MIQADTHKFAGYDKTRRGWYGLCSCGWSDSRRVGHKETAFNHYLKHLQRMAKLGDKRD